MHNPKSELNACQDRGVNLEQLSERHEEVMNAAERFKQPPVAQKVSRFLTDFRIQKFSTMKRKRQKMLFHLGRSKINLLGSFHFLMENASPDGNFFCTRTTHEITATQFFPHDGAKKKVNSLQSQKNSV